MEAPEAVRWRDDGSALMLSRAIERSIDYFAKVPASERFRYGELDYTPREMIASLRLFRELYLSAEDDEAFAEEVSRRFHVFESIRSGGRESNLFTGYYVPEIPASEKPAGELKTPLYAMPSDLVRVNLERFGRSLPRRVLSGRVVDGELVPYYSRRDIQGRGVLTDRAKPIAFVNEIDLFFLQIQGSGVLRFTDGSRVGVGYAAGNGHPYRSIGALLVRREEMEIEEVSLQSLRDYLAAYPDRARSILYHNTSYVFFRVRTEEPMGFLGVPVTPGRSMALDRTLFPRGGLIYVMTRVSEPFDPESGRELSRFMLAQDTGGAITGHGRGDLFFGGGKEAEWKAGHQKHSGRLFLLVARKEFLKERGSEN